MTRVAGLQLVLWNQRSCRNCPTVAGPLSLDRSCPRGQERKDAGPYGRPAATAVAHIGEGSKRVLALLGLPFNKSLLRDLDISFWSNPSSATVDM